MNDIIVFLKKLFPEACHNRIFLVGGSVRDVLLGKGCKDIDLDVALSPDELASIGFRLVTGKSTAPIWFKFDKTFGKIEATPLANAAGLTDDLAQRDFTINAMAMHLHGEVIDPLRARDDLEQRLLRACSTKSFYDDPVRIFRAFRFEADGWRMTPETESLILKQDWSQHFQVIPIERFSREMLKSLDSPDPERFFKRLLEFRIGKNYLPEIFRMPEIPAGPVLHHPEGNLFTHSIQVLNKVARQTNDPLSRFCALFHDIGKLGTDPANYPKHHGHDLAGFDLAHGFCDRLRLSGKYRTALAWTSKLHSTFNKWNSLRDSTKLRTAEQAIKAEIADILPLVAAADKSDEPEIMGWENAIQTARMTIAELGIDYKQLESIPEGNRAEYILQRRIEMLRKLLS